MSNVDTCKQKFINIYSRISIMDDRIAKLLVTLSRYEASGCGFRDEQIFV